MLETLLLDPPFTRQLFFLSKVCDKVTSNVLAVFNGLKENDLQKMWYTVCLRSNRHWHAAPSTDVFPAMQSSCGKIRGFWVQRSPWVLDASLIYWWRIFHNDGCPGRRRGNNRILQSQASKEDAKKSPNQLAAWYHWLSIRCAEFHSHEGRVHISDSQMLVFSVAMSAALVPITVSTSP